MLIKKFLIALSCSFAFKLINFINASAFITSDISVPEHGNFFEEVSLFLNPLEPLTFERREHISPGVPLEDNIRSSLYFVKTGDRTIAVLKILNKKFYSQYDIESEIETTIYMGKKSISPSVLYYNLRKAYYLVEYLESLYFASKVLRENVKIRHKIYALVRKLHESSAKLSYRSEPIMKETFQRIPRLLGSNIPLPNSFLNLLKQVLLILDIFFSRKEDIVSCHFDLHSGNVLYTTQKAVKFVDFEFSSEGDRFLDLASFAISMKLDSDQELELLSLYFDKEGLSPFYYIKFNLAKKLFYFFRSIREFSDPFLQRYFPYKKKVAQPCLYFSSDDLDLLYKNELMTPEEFDYKIVNKNFEQYISTPILLQRMGIICLKDFYKYVTDSYFAVFFQTLVTNSLIRKNLYVEKIIN